MFSANRVLEPYSDEELRQLARQTRRRVRFLSGSNLTLIKSRVAPAPSLLFRCSRNLTSYQLEDFVVAVADRKSFHRRLRAELDLVERVLAAKEWVARDFQALVDTRGNLYQIDVQPGPFEVDDRNLTPSLWKEMCLNRFQANTRILKRELKEQF